MIPELSIVSPDTGGLPVAYGVCEALRAPQVYWADRKEEGGTMRFRQYLEQKPGEKVLLVDDILRSGRNLSELKRLVESTGAEVVGMAVIIYQPTPKTVDFSPLPLYYLAQLDAHVLQRRRIVRDVQARRSGREGLDMNSYSPL